MKTLLRPTTKRHLGTSGTTTAGRPVNVCQSITAEEMQRQLKLYGCIVPAVQIGSCQSRRHPHQLDTIIPGRERTAYFYRKMAILFAQDARRRYLEKLFPGYIETHAWLAKSYLKTYRQMKGVAA